MEDIKIKLDENEYIIKFTFRAWLMYEEKEGKPYGGEENKMNPQFKMIYYLLCAANPKTFNFSFDECIDLFDRNQEAVLKLIEYLKSLGTDNKKKVENQ